MNRNNSDNNTEAVKIANALKPFVKKWFDDWGQSCVRSKKMTVTTAPNGSVIGVTDAFSDSEILIKYMSSCANAVVGDTVWVKWMYDNMQTLYADRIGNFDRDNYVPVSGGTFTGDVEFEGAVDIVPRRCTAGLSSAGWYRVMHYDGMYADDAKGGSGFIIDINIARNFYHENNETHSIKLMGVFNTIRFMNEVSNSATVDIDQIRWTYNGADAYVDIHYNSNNLNGVAVSFNVESFPDVCKRITAESLQAVADAPVGETIVSTYTFNAKGTGDATVNGFLDVVSRRAYATLSSAGWYRVLTYEGRSGGDDAKGVSGLIIDFDITRDFSSANNEVHSVKLFATYNDIKFANECSKSATQLIDKIRWNYKSNDAYVDIHYTGTGGNNVTVCFEVKAIPEACNRIRAESLQSVADAPSGETALSTYNFVADKMVGSFGTPVTISTFPYTVNEDGFMWVEMRCSSTGRFYTNFPGVFICDGYTASGAYMNGTFPVKKGTTLPTPDEINVSSVKYRWYPL